MKKMFKILQVLLLALVTQSAMAQLNGTYRIGTTPIPGETGSYASFGAAVTALNAGGVSGPCTFYFSDNGTTYTEAADVAIGYTGGSSTNTVTFKPYTGVTCTLSFTLTTAGVTIDGNLVIGAANASAALPGSLISTNYLTFDGSNTNGGTTKDLTITGPVTANQKSVIRIFGNNDFLSIKNCIITNNCSSTSTNAAINVTNYFSTPTNYNPDNLVIQNNTITSTIGSVSTGVHSANSGSPTVGATNMTISNNIVAGNLRGLFISYTNDGNIFGNTITAASTGTTTNITGYGITLQTNFGTAGTFNVYNNNLTSLSTQMTAAAGASNGMIGIDNQCVTPKIVNIYNNVIRGFATLGSANNARIYGIRNTSSSVTSIYNNSIYLPEMNNMAANNNIAGIAYASAANTEASPTSTSICMVKNNAIHIDETTMKVWGIRRVGTAGSFTSDNNVVFINAGNAAGYFGFFNATDYTTLATWTAASAQDAASYNVSPTFTSATDLTPTTAYPGAYIASVTNDILGTTRQNAPTIGAYEAGTMIGGVWRSTASNPGFANGTNWRDNVAPSIGTDLYIPSGAVNYPSLGSTHACNRIVNYGTINLTGPGFLQLLGNLVNNGTITNGTDGVGLTSGSIAQTIFGNGSIGILKNFNSIGASIGTNTGDTVKITSVFYPHATAAFTTNGKLILKSTSIANTAIVATGNITGNVQVERFIPAGNRAFRLLAPGVTGSTIKAAWQEGATTASFNPNATYGTHITGTAGTAGTVNVTSGFDETTLGNPSLYTFNNAAPAWVAATTTIGASGTFTDAKVGYRLLIRGDRTVTNISASSSATMNAATTLRNTGTLASGAQNFTLASSDGQYSFIGNPYWAPVNWATVGKTNLNTNFWIWDPTIAGSFARGGYVALSSGNVQPGQAFFVLNAGGAGALSFAETDRNIAGTLTNTFRTANTSDGKLIAKLYLQQNFAAGLMADIASTEFSKEYKSTIGKEDAPKFGNPDENLSFKTLGTTLSINGTVLPAKQDTLWLNMGNMLSKNYVLAIEGKEFANTANTEAYLVDSYSNTQTTINLNGEINVPYIIDANTASAAANRFYIVFNANKIVLPIAADKVEMKLTPNPATDYVQVNYGAKQKGNTVIRIINNNGQIVTTVNLGEQQAGQYKVPVSKLAAGIYTVELMVGEERNTAKLVKQ
jgi:Secretion system C-terminal sorting domain